MVDYYVSYLDFPEWMTIVDKYQPFRGNVDICPFAQFAGLFV